MTLRQPRLEVAAGDGQVRGEGVEELRPVGAQRLGDPPGDPAQRGDRLVGPGAQRRHLAAAPPALDLGDQVRRRREQQVAQLQQSERKRHAEHDHERSQAHPPGPVGGGLQHLAGAGEEPRLVLGLGEPADPVEHEHVARPRAASGSRSAAAPPPLGRPRGREQARGDAPAPRSARRPGRPRGGPRSARASPSCAARAPRAATRTGRSAPGRAGPCAAGPPAPSAATTMSALASSTSSANRLSASGSGTLTLSRNDSAAAGGASTSAAVSTVLGITDSRPGALAAPGHAATRSTCASASSLLQGCSLRLPAAGDQRPQHRPRPPAITANTGCGSRPARPPPTTAATTRAALVLRSLATLRRRVNPDRPRR